MVKLTVFDIERVSFDDFLSALIEISPNGYEGLEGKERARRILEDLKRMGYELFVTPIPMPLDNSALKLLENSEIEVKPEKAEISAEVISILRDFCKTIKEPFRVLEIREYGGFRIIFGEFFESDEVVVLETNLDDVSGEIIANALRKLEEISLDVSAVHCIGKKGRPAVIIRALCKKKEVEEVAKVMMEETGSLGVRIIPVRRIVERRRMEVREVEVFGRKCRVRVKFSSSSILKPEFEDVRRISEELGLPTIAVYKEILRKL